MTLEALTYGKPNGPGSPALVTESDPRRRRVLRGFNLSAHCKLDGLPFLGAPTLADRAAQFLPKLAADGFELLRVPLVWEHLQKNGPGPFDATLVQGLRELCSLAAAQGFYVLLDLHQDAVSSYFQSTKDPTLRGNGLPRWALRSAFDAGDAPPTLLTPDWADEASPGIHHWAVNYENNKPLRRAMQGLGRGPFQPVFQAFAKAVAESFGDLPNLLGVDVLNEPHAGAMEFLGYSALRETVYAAFLAAKKLRKVGAVSYPALCAMPAGNWLVDRRTFTTAPIISTDAADLSSRSLFNDGNTTLGGGPGFKFWLSTMHLYDPRAGLVGPFPPTPARYADTLAAALELYAAWDTVPLVGEFGAPSTLGPGVQNGLLATWVDLFERAGLSWCHWNFNPEAPDSSGYDGTLGESYSVAYTAPDRRAVLPTSAYYDLLRPFARRLSGTIEGYAFAVAGGDWTCDLTLDAWSPPRSTEFWVPASLGPFTTTAQGATLSTDPARPRRLLVTPTAARCVLHFAGGPRKRWG